MRWCIIGVGLSTRQMRHLCYGEKTLTIFGWSVVNILNKPRNSFDCA